MKKIKISVILTCCLLQMTTLFAQQKFTVQGKIELLTKSKHIRLGDFNIPIKPDGTFEFSAEVAESGKVMMQTDSSSLYVLWLTKGNYLLDCKEYKQGSGKFISFKAALKSGPEEAKVYDDFQQQSYSGFSSYFPKGNKSPGENRQQKVVIKYTDSIFKRYPKLKSLPDILSSAYHFVGDSATKRYIGMITPEMQKNEAIQRLRNDLDRQDKIDKEILFEDFHMNTADGGDFKLSDLKDKKIILVDFWASSCGPCRADHPNFIKMYEKYAGRGFEIVSVSLDNNTDAWQKAINQDKINTWINVSDLKGWQSDLVKNYYLYYIPFRFMLDGNRKILKVLPATQLPSEKDIEANL